MYLRITYRNTNNMSPQFKKLYCQYIEKGITSSDIGKFRNELNNIPDEELWNTMIDMENDTVEIKDASYDEKSKFERNYNKINLVDAVGDNMYRNMLHYRYHPIILFWTLYMDE